MFLFVLVLLVDLFGVLFAVRIYIWVIYPDVEECNNNNNNNSENNNNNNNNNNKIMIIMIVIVLVIMNLEYK